jgi:hypothetical protein
MPSSKASETFGQAIQDAENLLAHFNKLNTQPPPAENEVLKRAGLIMAMTAWETFVEDRLQEFAALRLAGLSDSSIGTFVQSKLDDEIKRLHNPTSEKSLQLFRDFAGVDLTEHWAWNNYPPKLVRERLNQYMKLRGDVVHRSRTVQAGQSQAHPVKKEDLERVISFLKELVKATDKGLQSS